MQKKVRDYINQYQMFSEGDVVVAAVSGGADSVCLLHLLSAIKKEIQIEIRGVHVHHGIRGREADRDADYVEELCRRLEVPCLVVRKDVPGYASEQRMSLEEAGRALRYEVFRNEAGRYPSAKIAVAHHRDDQAETILHNLFRGSSLKGLGGMAPVREDIVRPLLCVSRREILEYLKENRIEYCEDSTNLLEEYTRNKLRHVLIPMAVSDVNQGAVEHVLHAGEMISHADAYLSEVALRLLRGHGLRKSGGIGMPIEVMTENEPIIRTYIVMEMMREICGSRKDLTARHVEQILELLWKETGARTDLPYALSGRKCYGELWIEDKNIQMTVDTCKKNSWPDPEYCLFSYEKHYKIPENEYTKWFDYDKIVGTLSVRSRKTGDYFTLKDEKRKSIKSYMIDEKIPRELRDQIPLLADGSHIIWIVGYRISEYYKVTDKTKQVLQVKIDGGRNYGR